MDEKTMRDCYAAWEKAKRVEQDFDADIAKAQKRLGTLGGDVDKANEVLQNANNAANQGQALTGFRKPRHADAIASAESKVREAIAERDSARTALAELQQRGRHAANATAAALNGARKAREAVTVAKIDRIQGTLRADASLQARLRELRAVLEWAPDPSVGMALAMTWEELILETFAQPAEISKAA